MDWDLWRFALIGIIPLSTRMTRNLTVLTKEAENLAHGDLTARVQVASKDEFGKLAQAFNRMAAGSQRESEAPGRAGENA